MFEEAVTKELEAVYVHMDNLRRGRMQGKTTFSGPLSHHFHGRCGFVRSTTRNHKVICVASHLVAEGRHLMVQFVQIQIAQQGADNRSLRPTRDRRPLILAVQTQWARLSPENLRTESCGPIVHFQLLSSSSCKNAVTFS